MDNPETSVRVAVRIRPQISREIIDQCQICTRVTPGEPQVCLGQDKAFTYDYVFDINSTQTEVYDNCVRKLVEGCFSGYNATVLAYGQTGSGKTYTMGTGFEPTTNPNQDDENQGIVPRAMYQIFNEIERRRRESSEQSQLPSEFQVTAQFLELYNEDIIDLFDHTRQIKILQENDQVQTYGATCKPVKSVAEAFECLKAGALSRTTASTQMNTHSSRSHAIFTLNIHQTRVSRNAPDVETLSAKFHFVDLAGSERLKRTGATGERAKEGISINTGLLCLGNVISALGDRSKKASHVPYRDSKLTRLLQDSLGGNSQTLMIACISPSDRDFTETLSTLRYANRARNIRNKVFVNQDTSSNIIALLRKEIATLKAEIAELRQGRARRESLFHQYEESDISSEKILEDAKRDVKKLKALTYRMMNNNVPPPDCPDTTGPSIHDSCDSNNDSNDGGDEIDDQDDINDDDGDDEDNGHEDDDLDVGEEEDDEEECSNHSGEEQLNQLEDEITTKELLIAQLEKSQRQMQSLKHHYESKLIQLQNEIAEIVKERDQVLIKLTQGGNKPDEKTKKVHEDYNKKIKTLQADLKKYQDAKKEHAAAMRNQARYEQQIRKLRNEVSDMKRQKVNIMTKMKDEANRHRSTELQSNKRIAQLSKQERIKDFRIKNLEMENHRIKQMLKRKDAEVKALKSKAATARLLNQLVGIDNLYSRQSNSAKARRLTRTPQELLFERSPGYE